MLNKVIKYDVDPLVNYKGRYNRKTWEHLKRFGTLSILVDCFSVFDEKLTKVEQGDFIISINDGIEYVVISVSKLEGTDLTRFINIQPLFNTHNWDNGFDSLFTNMKIDKVI